MIKGEITVDTRGKQREFRGVMQQAFTLAEEHVSAGLQVVAVFLSDDAQRVKALMDENQWPCEAVLVSGGLSHPVVQRLGILSADRVPNPVLLRPDGSIAWQLSGLVHPQLRSEGQGELVGVITRGIKSNIEKLAMEHALATLAKGDHEQAMSLFSGPFPFPEKLYGNWYAPRLHGRAAGAHGHEILGSRPGGY